MGVGMPAALYLQDFGALLYDAFGEMPYHVGSSLLDKAGWRDVDIRVLLPDARYAAEGYGDPERAHANPKWVAMTLAFSELGRKMTGLPIDFQLQQSTHANACFSSKGIDGKTELPESDLPAHKFMRSAIAVLAHQRRQTREDY